MSENELLVEIRDYLCTITINRPHRRNALNVAVLRGLGDTLNSFKDNKEVRVVVLRGAGEEAFSSGMDLLMSQDSEERERRRGALPYARESILACPCPVIAMVFGYVAGAGCDLAVTCDIRFAADSARFALNAVKMGLVYDYEAIQRLINLIGVGYTKEFLLSGKFVDVQRAKEMGLVNFIVPRDKLLDSAMAFARELAENPPLAVAGTKQAMARLMSYQKPSPQDKAEIQAMIEKSWNSEDASEARRAFAEKRKPFFQGK